MNENMFDVQVTTATEAKTRFWEFLDKAQKKPVLIRKNNRDHSVIISIDDYEDMLLWIQAYKAEQEGFLWVEESKKVLDSFR